MTHGGTMLKNVITSKAIGFEGMGCTSTHDRSSRDNGGFASTADEMIKRKRWWLAYHEALEKGLGVVALGIEDDRPACGGEALRKTITLAVSLGLLPENWEEAEANAVGGKRIIRGHENG
ncbi:MAG: hypothetical protein U5L72_19895 [Bacteroidales bacterium]|nr:hypothetical protein [Bacteroidales bacterium]